MKLTEEQRDAVGKTIYNNMRATQDPEYLRLFEVPTWDKLSASDKERLRTVADYVQERIDSFVEAKTQEAPTEPKRSVSVTYPYIAPPQHYEVEEQQEDGTWTPIRFDEGEVREFYEFAPTTLYAQEYGRNNKVSTRVVSIR